MQEKSERRSNADRTAATRAGLLAAARALFVEKGYADTSTPDVVRRAEVTRGALYHHFADKAALFRAVVEAEAGAVAQEIAQGAGGDAALDAGTRAYFRAMAVPGRARLLLVDGPAVLGWREMELIDGGGGRAELTAGLREARPDLPPDRLDALALVLSAGFDRAALAIAEGAEPEPYEAAMLGLVSAVSRAR